MNLFRDILVGEALISSTSAIHAEVALAERGGRIPFASSP